MAANGLVPTYLAMTYSFATGGPEYLLGVSNAFETPLAWLSSGTTGAAAETRGGATRRVIQAAETHHEPGEGSAAGDEQQGDGAWVSGERRGGTRGGRRFLARRIARSGGDWTLGCVARLCRAVAVLAIGAGFRDRRFVVGLSVGRRCSSRGTAAAVTRWCRNRADRHQGERAQFLIKLNGEFRVGGDVCARAVLRSRLRRTAARVVVVGNTVLYCTVL